MALYDHRVFRDDNGAWWIAQVHSGSGASFGTPSIQRERVFFSCMSDKNERGRTAAIKPNSLNRLSHAAVLEVLRKADLMDHGLKMYPYNAPSAGDFIGQVPVTDGEGLQ